MKCSSKGPEKMPNFKLKYLENNREISIKFAQDL
jgi:hypothetical protein